MFNIYLNINNMSELIESKMAIIPGNKGLNGIRSVCVGLSHYVCQWLVVEVQSPIDQCERISLQFWVLVCHVWRADRFSGEQEVHRDTGGTGCLIALLGEIMFNVFV